MGSKSLAIKTAKNPSVNPEVIKVSNDADQVSCDGGHDVLGHPLTYYNFGHDDKVVCQYCDREFVRRAK